MKFTTAGAIGSLAAVATASHDEMTFAVLRFNGQGFLTEGRMDPVVNPGTEAPHYHGIMGGNKFGTTVEGDQLLSSTCTTAKIANDFSNYWAPSLFFQDPNNPSNFTKVDLMYMNVYYFFDKTDDDIEPFPPGLKMLVGDVSARTPPKSGSGAKNIYSNMGDIQPVQWTCPRASSSPPSYPADSDGTTAGMAEPGFSETGVGFPFQHCDKSNSPLRADIHFPSCYNPSVGLEKYKENMAWPEDAGDGKSNCPEGYVHVPHLFYELYWETMDFKDAWVPDGKSQPFVLSNGDRTGYSLHADFISGWDETTLKWIIDNCNAKTLGMDTCSGIPGGLTDPFTSCKLEPEVPEPVDMINNSGVYLEALPGNNKCSGWGVEGESHNEGSAPSYPTKPVNAPSSSAQAPVETYVAESPVASPEPAATYEAEALSEYEAETPGAMSTVWDIVTVTQTAYAYATPTPEAVKRHLHGHDHMARHQRRGFAGRR